MPETIDQRKKRLAKERQDRFRKKQRNNNHTTPNEVRHELGRMDQTCIHCGAKFWMEEKINNSSQTSPIFTTCCAGGKVNLPPVLEPPPYLLNLYTSSLSDACSFRNNIRAYNSLLACSSFGANIDKEFQNQGISNFKIHGQVYHRIGSLLPDENQLPVFAQLYIYDTDHENSNRLHIMQDLDANILQSLQDMLDIYNPYIQNFRQVRDILSTNNAADISMRIYCDRSSDPRRYNTPTASDVAAIMIGDGFDINPSNRDIVLRLHDGSLQRISESHPSYDPLQYVLLFPKGDDGWHLNIPLIENGQRETVTPMQFYSYRLQVRDGNWLHCAGRLYQQYIVDQYAKIEQDRLNYLRLNQKSLRAELYRGVADAIHIGDNSNTIGRRIILPSSFIGGPRQMYQLYQDAMSIVGHFGKPDLFVTFTCNPKWQEITRELMPHQSAADRPDLTARVFHIKLQELLKDLCEKHCLGTVVAFVYVIEFQKRGLPHAHILLILSPDAKLHSIEDYDSIVSAEIPNQTLYPFAYETVVSTMMHGPCGEFNPSAPCMKDGKCQKGYPKLFQATTHENNDGYPVYRRRDNGSFAEVRGGIHLDNQWVVPHNVKLVTKYNAHINVEICSSILAIKYLYKYFYKGHDRATIALSQLNHNNMQLHDAEPVDEIKMYLDARYISTSEAIWRIFHYKMHSRFPNVQRLTVHLPDHQLISFHDNENLQEVMSRADSHATTLVAWFQENSINPTAHAYRYIDFSHYYTWNSSQHKWNIRKTSTSAIGRIYMVHPSEGERYYLRILLTHVRGATSFNDLKTVNGHVCRTFKEACIYLGLLQDDTEWHTCLYEASQIKTGQQLRHLFATLLLFCQPTTPELLWNNHKLALCEDILYQNRDLYSSLNDTIEQEALRQLESYLQLNAKSLKDFPNMPLFLGESRIPDSSDSLNQFIREEMSYNNIQLENELSKNLPLLNKDQCAIYNAILLSINQHTSECFFIDGPGGTGKTFLYNTLLATIRLHNDIALAVASSGISALLISGGRTAHSRFKIPLKLDELSTCNISHSSKEAYLINSAKLIIWDEAPMLHKFAFEALDRTFRDITSVDKPFGGKTFVFGGDFRQVLPVIPHSQRADVVSASLSHSYLWKYLKVMKLTINMRLISQTQDPQETIKQKKFAEFILNIGDGKYPIVPGTEDKINLPSDIVMTEGHLPALINFVYPNLIDNYRDANYIVGRAILTPKNVDVQKISDLIMNNLPGDFTVYPSADSVDLSEDSNTTQPQMYSPEFLRSLKIPELPPGELKLKVGVPIILIRNLNPSQGLCNGTRLICRVLQNKVIEAEIITGSYAGKHVFIPRITLTSSNNTLPFILKRRQFPIRVAFSMSINKSQGQTLNYVGIYLPQPVFAHGQLYVAISRVISYKNIKILIDNNHNSSQNCQTRNVVYKEVFI